MGAVRVNCTFGGTDRDLTALTRMTGTSIGRLGQDGLLAHVAPFIRRLRGDPLENADSRSIETLRACPTAYALVRHAGLTELLAT